MKPQVEPQAIPKRQPTPLKNASNSPEADKPPTAIPPRHPPRPPRRPTQSPARSYSPQVVPKSATRCQDDVKKNRTQVERQTTQRIPPRQHPEHPASPTPNLERPVNPTHHPGRHRATTKSSPTPGPRSSHAKELPRHPEHDPEPPATTPSRQCPAPTCPSPPVQRRPPPSLLAPLPPRATTNTPRSIPTDTPSRTRHQHQATLNEHPTNTPRTPRLQIEVHPHQASSTTPFFDQEPPPENATRPLLEIRTAHTAHPPPAPRFAT